MLSLLLFVLFTVHAQDKCDVGAVSNRVNCHPERGATEHNCKSRGCCWNPCSAKGGCPWCFYPQGVLKSFTRQSAWNLQKGEKVGFIDLGNCFGGSLSIIPLKKVGGWCNLFHVGNYDQARKPAAFLYPGRTRLHFRTSTDVTWNEGCDVDYDLPLNIKSNIRFVACGNTVSVSIRNKDINAPKALTCKLRGKIIGGAQNLYVSDPWNPVCDVKVENVKLFRTLPNVAHDAACIFPFTYQGKQHNSCTLVGEKQCWCSTQVNASGAHIGGKWQFCKDQTCKAENDKKLCHFPFIYENKEYNSCTDVNENRCWCSTKVNASGGHIGGQWRWCSEQKCKVHDGQDKCDVGADSNRVNCHPESGATEHNCKSRGCCWNPCSAKGGCPWCFYPKGVPKSFTKTRPWNLQKGKKNGFIDLGNCFAGSFSIIPLKKVGGWCNLFHVGNYDQARKPAAFLYPGRTRLHFRTSTDANSNEGCDVDYDLPLNKKSNVEFFACRKTVSVSIRNEDISASKSLTCKLKGKIIGGAQNLYVSDPWNLNCEVKLENVKLRALPNGSLVPCGVVDDRICKTGSTCGSRKRWLMENKDKSENQAREDIEWEFPDICKYKMDCPSGELAFYQEYDAFTYGGIAIAGLGLVYIGWKFVKKQYSADVNYEKLLDDTV